MSELPPSDFGSATPPDPAPFKRSLVPDMKDASEGTRVAGFIIGAEIGLLAGIGLWIAGAIMGSTVGSSGDDSLGILIAGLVNLALAILVGRWLWKTKQMKGTAVGLILTSALWCVLDVTCGLGLWGIP